MHQEIYGIYFIYYLIFTACPSGVAVEISRDGRSALVPVSPPVDTSGLTFIRLQLPQSEVVTTVLLRLYKPRDSSNIGLSQIRLLGCTTFGDTSNFNIENVSTDDHVIQSRFVYSAEFKICGTQKCRCLIY